MELMATINRQIEDIEKELGKESVEDVKTNLMHLKIKVDFYEGKNSGIIQPLWTEYLQNKSLGFTLILSGNDKSLRGWWRFRKFLNLNDKLTEELLRLLKY